MPKLKKASERLLISNLSEAFFNFGTIIYPILMLFYINIVVGISKWNKRELFDVKLTHSVIFIRINKSNRIIITELSGQFSDDNAIAFVYPYEDNGVGKFHVEQFSFIPLRNSNNDINVKEHQDGINYRAEVEKGFGKITDQ